MESVRSVSKLSTEFVGSRRRELVANCVHTAVADATKQFRRRWRCVLGITQIRLVSVSRPPSAHVHVSRDRL